MKRLLLFALLLCLPLLSASDSGKTAQVNIYLGDKASKLIDTYIDAVEKYGPSVLNERLLLVERFLGKDINLIYEPAIGEYGISYPAFSNPDVTITIGKGASGGYLRASWTVPLSSEEAAQIIAEEIRFLAQNGVLSDVEQKDIQAIKDMLWQGSDTIVHAGSSQISGVAEAVEAPYPPAPPTGSISAVSGGAPIPPQPPSGGASAGSAPALGTQILQQVLGAAGETDTAPKYYSSPDNNWVGVKTGRAQLTSAPLGTVGGETETGRAGADAGTAETRQSPAEDFALVGGLIALTAVGTVLFGALLLAIYQIFFRAPQLDYEAHKALSNETRALILSELSDVEKIPTDLSLKLEKSKATISEHLERLVLAGLVEKIEKPGRKFVFYRITSKGKSALRQQKAG